jgi:multiple sugar transport system permease protein
VSNFLVFAPVQILTAGGPQGDTNLIMNEIYSQAFVMGDATSAAVATAVLVTVVLLIVALQFRLISTKEEWA